MSYIARVVDGEIDELLPALPALVLEGPRGVGKTETASRRASSIFRLDEGAQLTIAEAAPHRLIEAERPILIDEWQRFPESWDLVRRAVDADSTGGQFLLTGSASPLTRPTHSGAGRIVSIRMRPLTLSERGVEDPPVSLRDILEGSRPRITGETEVGLEEYTHEITASGFPGLRGYAGRALRAQLDGYIGRIVDADFLDMGQPVRKPQVLQRWMSAYAAATATATSYERILDAATPGVGDKPRKATTQSYREVLEQLWILDPLPAWIPTRNPIGRLSQPPKHHLADPALAARLLGAEPETLLAGKEPGPRIPRDGTLMGHLFESLVALDVRVYAQAAEARVGHLRTYGGEREVDLIVERRDQRIVAIETKLASAISDDDVANLLWLRDRIGDQMLDAVVVHTGPHAYRRADGVAVVPAALLGP